MREGGLGAYRAEQPDVACLSEAAITMLRIHRRRYVGASHIAHRLGVTAEMFLRLYEQPLWRVPRPRVDRDRACWDMVEVEYWLDTLAHV